MYVLLSIWMMLPIPRAGDQTIDRWNTSTESLMVMIVQPAPAEFRLPPAAMSITSRTERGNRPSLMYNLIDRAYPGGAVTTGYFHLYRRPLGGRIWWQLASTTADAPNRRDWVVRADLLLPV